MAGRDIEDVDADRLSHASLARGDATGWFERLYAEADHGSAIVPWDRGTANPMLVEWSERAERDRSGTALVVGAGYGTDAVYLAELGHRVTAFDIASTAIAEAARRFADRPVTFTVADLLHPPAAWTAGFDLVLESYTVQALPLSLRATATTNVSRFVAPGGTLLVIGAGRSDDELDPPGPPWPLTRAEVTAFADHGLTPVLIEQLRSPTGGLHWRAEWSAAQSPTERSPHPGGR